MAFCITGLPTQTFQPLFGLDAAALRRKGVLRKVADSDTGYPCRITLKHIKTGQPALLLNFTSHAVETPFRSAYAIYVDPAATQTTMLQDQLPEVLLGRSIALRIFDKTGMLLGAELDTDGQVEQKIKTIFNKPEAAYIHAHTAAYGCFLTEIARNFFSVPSKAL
ncbi:MAG: hypothetical protein COA47_00615 [Robiginitomaculum sp.]|nr:MAG: hypothetical protein COA47_00615 [Robiginitomaculum sp.]